MEYILFTRLIATCDKVYSMGKDILKIVKLCPSLEAFVKNATMPVFYISWLSGVSWLWEELYAKLLGLGQLLGYPWKVWGITVQTSYWEGRWHQNCGYTSPILFWGYEQGNQWKTELRTRKFSTVKFSGQAAMESLCTQDSENLYERGAQKIVDLDLDARSRVSAFKCSPLAKICGPKKKYISQNLRNWASPRNSIKHNFKDLGACPRKSLLPIDYGKKWWGPIPKIVGDMFFATAQLSFFFFGK